jgi:hypothetical protein
MVTPIILPNLPMINGHRYSFASIELKVDDRLYVALQSVNYTDQMEPGVIYGTDPSPIGRTPGQRKMTANFEILRREFDDLIKYLGASYGRKRFSITVQYAEEGDEGVTTDLLVGCRISGVDLANTQGTDPTAVRISVSPLDIQLNGVSMDATDVPAADQSYLTGEQVL